MAILDKLKKTRKKTPPEIEAETLIKCRRRCALCFGLNNDFREKKNLQIIHIDDDPSNYDPNNLVALCLDHHAEVHKKNPISKGFTPLEIRTYKDLLYKEVDKFTSPSEERSMLEKSIKVILKPLEQDHDLFGYKYPLKLRIKNQTLIQLWDLTANLILPNNEVYKGIWDDADVSVLHQLEPDQEKIITLAHIRKSGGLFFLDSNLTSVHFKILPEKFQIKFEIKSRKFSPIFFNIPLSRWYEHNLNIFNQN